MAKAKPAPAIEAATTDEDDLPKTAVKERVNARTMKQLQEQMAASVAVEPPEDEPTDEEKTWKKRYGDLRSHTQKQLDERQKQINDLGAQIEQLNKAVNKPMPKSKEEFLKWREDYPDIVPFIEMIADERASERAKALQEELESVKDHLSQTEQEKALVTLKSLVPDIEEVALMPEYAAWLDGLSSALKERVLNSEDPYEVRDYMNMFKSTLDRPKTNTKDKKIDVLDTGVKQSTTAPSRSADSFKYKESDIKALSPEKYAELEADIEAAHKEGKVLLDITGRTRFHTNV